MKSFSTLLIAILLVACNGNDKYLFEKKMMKCLQAQHTNQTFDVLDW